MKKVFFFKKTAVVSILLGLMVFSVIVSCSSSDNDSSTRIITIGALLPLTDFKVTRGINAQVLMNIAIEEINTYLDSEGGPFNIQVLFKDTKYEPERALELLKELVEMHDVRVVIGPQSSAEVNAIKDYADQNGVLIVSYASTAGSLAIEGDNIYRFCPDDSLEAVATSTLMIDSGEFTTIVPVWRDDLGNKNLKEAVGASFTAKGGTFLTGVEYSADETDFTAVATAVHNAIAEAVDTYGSSTTSVYLAAFDEVVDLFTNLSDDSTATSVLWGGSSSTALTPVITDDSTAAAFAVTVGFPNPLFGYNEDARYIWEPLAIKVEAQTGITPDAFSLAAYDALWVSALAYTNIGDVFDINTYKDEFVNAADVFFGATGYTLLNDAGDRAYANFDYWDVCTQNDGSYYWRLAGTYDMKTGALSFTKCGEE